MELYWLSENLDLSGRIIKPAPPQNSLVQIDKTPRIPLYSSISDAISVYSIGKRSVSGRVLGVYRPRVLRADNRITPELQNCPYLFTLEEKEYWSLIPIELVKIADIRIGEKIEDKIFNYGSSRQHRGAFVKPVKIGKYSWSEVLPEWDKKGKTMKLKRKYFGSTSDMVTEDKPVAREIGRGVGSLGLGLASGLAVKGLAEDSKDIVDRVRDRILFKPSKKGPDGIRDASFIKEGSKKLKRVDKIHKIARKKAERISEFAKTKGGKAALVGIPTAIIGGAVYVSSKKKDKKKK